MTIEKKTFDFNLKGKKGIAEIIYGKGSAEEFFVSILGISFAFLVLPWIMEWKLVFFRFLFLLLMVFDVFGFYKSIIRLSLDHNNLYIRIWKTEKAFRIDDIKQIKVSCIGSGWITVTVKLESAAKHYFLNAPNFEKERHRLFLDMVDYLEKRLSAKIRIRGLKLRKGEDGPVCGIQAMIQKTGIVIEKCDPEGKVRIGNEFWTALAMEGTEIDIGEQIIVRDIKGMKLIVEKHLGEQKEDTSSERRNGKWGHPLKET